MKEEGEWGKFCRKVKNLEPGVDYVYFAGELARSRLFRRELDQIARFVSACGELGYGVLFQRRNNDAVTEYVIRLNRKLGMRKDGNGCFQEAERVASL